MIRIYADFNCQDESGRVSLNTVGSLRDLNAHRSVLEDGLRIIMYTPEEFEVEGVLVLDGTWLGIPDYRTLRYYDER